MKQGDFSSLAKNYKNRVSYSETILRALMAYVGARQGGGFVVADVGAGTGKFTEMLLAMGLTCMAVEPNDAMREEGIVATQQYKVKWQKGSGEETGLPDGSANWLTMASSFHWVNRARAVKEFHRVLKPRGYFTALWNPRNLQKSEFHMGIEAMIQSVVPDLKRVSSGSAQCTETLSHDIVSTGHFKDVVFMEAEHEVVMTPERYLGAWQSVNDIQAQAGPERWQTIMDGIKHEIRGMKEIVVPYKTRAWTAQRV